MAGTGVAVTAGDLIPTTDDAGGGVYTKGRNNARDIRVGMLGSLYLSGSDGATPRDGILIRSNGADDLAVLPNGTPNQTVTIRRGKAVINRVGQGPYIFESEADQIVNMPAASAVNSRIDLVCCSAYDKAAFVGDAAHGPQFWVEQGVVSGSPVVPSTPAGMLAIARVLRATNDNTISTGEITDLRVSTAVGGSFRTILPGETVAGVGQVLGETRYTSLIYGPEVWTGAAWVPIADKRMTTKRYITGSGLGTTTVTGTNVQIMTTGAVAYRAGLVYEIEFGVNWDANTGTFGNGVNDTHVLEIKDTNISGTAMFADMVKQNGTASVPLWTSGKFQYKPAADITKTFIACITRVTGSGTITARAATSGSTYAAVTVKGLASDVVDV